MARDLYSPSQPEAANGTGTGSPPANLAVGGTSPSQLDLRIDAEGRFSIQLWTCQGGKDEGPLR